MKSAHHFWRVTLVMLSISACGWRPLYQKNHVTEAMGRIQVAHILGRDGQILRGYLLENLHPFATDDPSQYILKVKFSSAVQNIGYNTQGSVVRTEEQGNVEISLHNTRTREILIQETLMGSYSYPVQALNPHTTSLSQERRYLLEYLAHRIVTRVAQTLETSL